MADFDQRIALGVYAAIDNMAVCGDTDIFPQSLQTKHFLRDRKSAIRAVIELHKNFQDLATTSPPHVLRSLVPAGQLGLRLGSQIAPLWNAYYLGLAIVSAPAIERIRASPKKVYSYRFVQPNSSGLIFDTSVGWLGFTESIRSACSIYKYVLVTDISDFYHRIRIDSLSSAMSRAGVAGALVERLARVLRLLEVDHFGLPVGGPASRILAEAALARMDAKLEAAGIPYVRFVDDIRVFANSERQAHRYLLELSKFLWDEGLSLQKSKTSALRSRDMLDELDLARSMALAPVIGFVLPGSGGGAVFSHDPYSELRVQIDPLLERFAANPDARSVLQREFSKSSLNLSLARSLLAALSFLNEVNLAEVLFDLLEGSERPALIPILSRMLEAIDTNLSRLTPASALLLRDRLESLMMDNSLIIQFDLHIVLVLRLLARMPCSPNSVFLDRLPVIYRERESSLVRCEIIALWAAWACAGEMQALVRVVDTLGAWEKATLEIVTADGAVYRRAASCTLAK